MVRTYKEDPFQLLSPWEKAMMNSDNTENSATKIGSRKYNKYSPRKLSYNEQANLKLPPITEDPQKTIEFLAKEVGDVLLRSKRILKKIKNEFVLYDVLCTGYITKSAACEILKRYKLPPNDNYQQRVINFFVTKIEPGKVDRVRLVEFLENSYQSCLNIAAQKEESERDSVNSKFSDSMHGRYDSETASHEIEYNPRKRELVNKAFADRRDAGLSLNIAQAFEASGKDSEYLIEKLEEEIIKSYHNERQEELRIVDAMHLKVLVAKMGFPLNTALTLKCIERLDPYNKGELEWPRFIEFLRKAVMDVPGRKESSSSGIGSSLSPLSNNEKPPWESKQPLNKIKRNKSITSESTDELYSSSNSGGADFGRTERYLKMDSHYSKQSSHEGTYDDMASMTSFKTNSERSTSPVNNSMNEKKMPTEYPDEIIQRVADALKDKAALNNGIISTKDVKRTVNYYNLLFDADIDMMQLDSLLKDHSKNDLIDIDIVINTLEYGALKSNTT